MVVIIILQYMYVYIFFLYLIDCAVNVYTCLYYYIVKIVTILRSGGVSNLKKNLPPSVMSNYNAFSFNNHNFIPRLYISISVVPAYVYV